MHMRLRHWHSPWNRATGISEKAFQILTAKAGIYGMVGGQTVDVESEGKPDMTKEKLDFIYRLKTSALIEGAMLTGAVLAGATQGEQKIIEQTAGEVGLAFRSRTTFWMSPAPWKY